MHDHLPNPGQRAGQRHAGVIVISAGNKPWGDFLKDKTNGSSRPWDIAIYLKELVAELEKFV